MTDFDYFGGEGNQREDKKKFIYIYFPPEFTI